MKAHACRKVFGMSVYHKRLASVKYPITQRDGVDGRTCKDCQEWKPLDDFYRITGRSNGVIEYQTRCKKCHTAVCNKTAKERREQRRVTDKVRYDADRERIQLRRRAVRYNVPEEELRAWLLAGCLICKGFDRLGVDHNHATTATRGLLCQGCNQGLGFFRDSPELLRKAAAYVETTGWLLPQPKLPKLPPGRRRPSA